jgi:hypothetical protein
MCYVILLVIEVPYRRKYYVHFQVFSKPGFIVFPIDSDVSITSVGHLDGMNRPPAPRGLKRNSLVSLCDFKSSLKCWCKSWTTCSVLRRVWTWPGASTYFSRKNFFKNFFKVIFKFYFVLCLLFATPILSTLGKGVHFLRQIPFCSLYLFLWFLSALRFIVFLHR